MSLIEFPPQFLSLAVILNDRLEVASIRCQRYERDLSKKDSGHRTGKTELKPTDTWPGKLSMALFLVLLRIKQHQTGDFTEDVAPILTGLENTPASSFHGAVHAKPSWLINLFGSRKNLGLFLSKNIKAANPSEEESGAKSYKVEWVSDSPIPITVYRQIKCPESGQMILEEDEVSAGNLIIAAQKIMTRVQERPYKKNPSKKTWENHLLRIEKPSTNHHPEKQPVTPPTGGPILPPPFHAWESIFLSLPKWNAIPTLHGSPIPIEEIYTEVYLVREEPRFIVPGEVSYHEDSGNLNLATLSVDSILTRIRHKAVFIGDPGSGKSTMAKWITRQLITDYGHLHTVPILILLRDFALALKSNPELSLEEFFFRKYCNLDSTETSNAVRQLHLTTRQQRPVPAGWVGRSACGYTPASIGGH